MKTTILSLLLLLSCVVGYSQGLLTKVAYVSFYSELEDVKAENFSGVSELDTASGRLLFSFAIQSFLFENATMQKHFNEADVMNSKEFPRAKFVGSILNNQDINYQADGEYTVTVEGQLTIRGTTNPVKTKGKIIIRNGRISATATFTLDRFIYGVTGMDDSISQILELNVKADYE